MAFSPFLVVLLCVALSCDLALCACSVSGCQPDRCSCASIDKQLSQAPKLLWTKKLALSKDGCLANGGRIVCPLDNETSIVNGGLESTDSAGTKRLSWDSYELGIMPLPVVDLGGAVIASDGYTLAGYDPLGKLIGVTALWPTNGIPHDLTYTANDLVLILYPCGLLTAYLTNGIPHASIWLNDTIDNVSGTFIPLLAPAFVLDRFYLLTLFIPNDKQMQSSNSFTIRVYAIDLRRVMVERFKTAWFFEYKGQGSVTVSDKMTKECTLTRDAKDLVNTIGNIMAVNDSVVAQVNYTPLDGEGGAVLISLSDEGDKFTKNFVNLETKTVTSISHPPYILQESPKEEQHIFVLSFGDEIHLIDLHKGTIISKFVAGGGTYSKPLILQSTSSANSFYLIMGRSSGASESVTATKVTAASDGSWQWEEYWSLPVTGTHFATVADLQGEPELVITNPGGQLMVYSI